VIAATNRSLAEAVRGGAFREDLFYRLAVVQIAVPALRERGRDALRLAAHFVERYAREEHVAPVRLTPAVEEILLAYPWPGNVRELRNLVERFTILSPGRELALADLPAEMRAFAPRPEAVPSPAAAPRGSGGGVVAPAAEEGDRLRIGDELANAERRLLEAALREAGGGRERAASLLGISRHALKRRLRRLGIL
jgi:DNA-binding NtrC family response regulator